MVSKIGSSSPDDPRHSEDEDNFISTWNVDEDVTHHHPIIDLTRDSDNDTIPELIPYSPSSGSDDSSSVEVPDGPHRRLGRIQFTPTRTVPERPRSGTEFLLSVDFRGPNWFLNPNFASSPEREGHTDHEDQSSSSDEETSNFLDLGDY